MKDTDNNIKPTPGTWLCDDAMPRPNVWAQLESGGLVHVATCAKIPEAGHNAMLLAAAPELMAALEYIEGLAMAKEWRDMEKIEQVARGALSLVRGPAFAKAFQEPDWEKVEKYKQLLRAVPDGYPKGPIP